MTPPPPSPTILLSSTAASMLSRCSCSVCAPLLMGKTLPADLGRFFRPELMHAPPPPELPAADRQRYCGGEMTEERSDAEAPVHPGERAVILRNGARTAGRRDPQRLPAHPRQRSHLQPLLKAGREAASSASPSPESTAKQVVTHG